MKHAQFVKTLLAIAAMVSLTALSAWGSTYKVIYNFTGGQDGANPVDAGALAIDADGNLYGTTQSGGSCGGGTLWELSPNGSGGWTESVWDDFCGVNGVGPTAAPILAPFGNCNPACPLGNTVYGGAVNSGVSFHCYFGPSSCQSFSYASFTNASFPYAPPSWITDDIFSGPASTLFNGGQNFNGELNWNCCYFSYDFCSVSGCADGANPASAVVQDGSGNIWGTTANGGSGHLGIVYEWTAYNCPDNFGQLQYCYNLPLIVLHSFAGGPNDGAYPFFATLTLTQSCSQFICGQTIWGTTPLGGAFGDSSGGYGTVWAINSFGLFSLVHSFNLFDGAWPFAGLTNVNGVFYSTTNIGGFVSGTGHGIRLGRGTIYSLTQNGTLTTLHVFTGPDGALPYSGLVADSNGNLYGVTYEGGAYGAGVVYEITP